MPKRIVTMVAGIVGTLAGGWLILAPFALGYRPRRGPWDHATEIDVWSGVGVVVVALVCLTAALLATVADLRARGALPALTRRAVRRQARSPQQDQTRRAQQDQAGGIEQSRAPGIEQGQAMGEGAAKTAAPPASPSGPAVPAVTPGDRRQADLRDLLTSLVQALLDDTRQADARPLPTRPTETSPGAVDDSAGAGRIGRHRWRSTS